MKLTSISSLLVALLLISCIEDQLPEVEQESKAELEKSAQPDSERVAAHHAIIKYTVDEPALNSYISDTGFLASTLGYVFIVLNATGPSSNSYLHRYNPYTGSGVLLTNLTGRVEAVASANGYIYMVKEGTLFRYNASNGSMTEFSDYPTGWSGTEVMTAYGGYLYAIQDATLWRVNLSNGDVGPFGQYYWNWPNTEAMTSHNGYLFAVQAGTLWRENLSNGNLGAFGQYADNWQGTEAMAAYGNYLYAVQDGIIWQENVNNGAIGVFHSGRSWWDTQAMTSSAGYIYILQGNTLFGLGAIL